MAGIYLHIPFCRQACHYCDFHFSTTLKTVDRMVDALCTDMALQAADWADTSFQTVYFGGGTPSVLNPDQLGKVTAALRTHFAIDPDAEWCLEANPDDLTTAALASWKREGIDRLSMGIQTFDPELLAAMNRSHSTEQALHALEVARQAGFDAFSADLIYAQPGQTEDTLRQDIATLVAQRPQHISAYCLTVEPGTALHHQVTGGQVTVPEDDVAEAHYRLLCTALAAAGYEHYEVSNWALPGQHSRHNSAYWRGEPYVGIGPSAHGFKGKRRYWHVSSNARYMQALEAGTLAIEEELLTERDVCNERIMTQLRTAQGLALDWLKDLDFLDFASDVLPQLQSLETQGWGTLTATHFTLTEPARFHADRIASDLFILES